MRSSARSAWSRTCGWLSAAERLQADYDAGRLNLDDFVYYSVLLGVSAPGVPAGYVDGAPAGTLPAVDDILTRYGAGLSQAGLQRIKDLFTPASGSNALRVQRHSGSQWCGTTNIWLAIPYDCHVVTAHFDIYWRSADHGMHNASGGLPDHIQEIVNAIEAANTAYVNLGFPAIAKRVAVHLSPLMPDCSGISLPEVRVLGLLINPEFTDIDNDPNWNCGDGNTYLIRHELFHHVQYQYRIDQFTNSWWMEGSAEWGAHMAQIAPGAPGTPSGRYSAHLGEYLAHPEQAFTADWSKFKDGAQYGSFILAEYLAENFGESTAIVNVWERIDHRATPTQAIVEFIHAQGSDLDTEVAKYRRWLYVIQSNDLGDGFADPDAQGQWQRSAAPSGRPGGWVKPQEVTLGRNLTTASGVVNLQGTGAEYIELNITYMHVGLLDVTVVGSDMSAWVMQYGAFPNGCWADNDQLSFNQNNGASAQLLIMPMCTRITLMIVNVNPATDKRYLPANWSIVYYPLTSIVSNGQLEIGVSPYGTVFGDYAGLRMVGKQDSDVLWFGAGDTWGISSDGQPPAVLDDFMYPFGLSVRDFFTVGNAVTSVVDAPGGLRVTHVFSPSGNSHLFNVLVAVTNKGQHELTSVRYRRTMMFLPPDFSSPSYGRNAYTTFAKIGGNTNYIIGSTDEVDPYPYQPLASNGGPHRHHHRRPQDRATPTPARLTTRTPPLQRQVTDEHAQPNPCLHQRSAECHAGPDGDVSRTS